MSWYDKLNEYFPIEEMKSKKHIDILLEEKRCGQINLINSDDTTTPLPKLALPEVEKPKPTGLR